MRDLAMVAVVIGLASCAHEPQPAPRAAADPPSLTSIKTPYGKYSLASIEPIELVFDKATVPPPSCGVEARALLDAFRTIDIVFEGDEVRVNGALWVTQHIGRHARPIKFGSTDFVDAKQPGRDPVSVTFSRSDRRSASGRLYYTKTEDSDVVCNDARQLRGRYRRH